MPACKPNEQVVRMRLLARFPSDAADEFDLDLRSVLLEVPFTDVDQSGLDEVEAVEELQDFFVGPEVYCREPCLLADVVGVGYGVGRTACRQVRDAQVAAGGHPLAELPEDPERVVLVLDDVKHAEDDHANRLVEVDERLEVWMIKHRLGPPDVSQDRVQPGADGPQRAAVSGDHRVEVDVDHMGGGVNAADRVMDAGRARGDATSQIDKLPDPLFCDVPDRALPELPVHPGGQGGFWSHHAEHLHGLAVDLVVVLS